MRSGTDVVLGGTSRTFCHRLQDLRPKWVAGSLSHSDSIFLFEAARASRARRAMEIGTGSGFSTTVLGHALDTVAGAGGSEPDFQIATCDAQAAFYRDPSRRNGDAAREMLPPRLLSRVRFVAPGNALDLREQAAENSVGFLFIDANHRHPWPTLDLLALLPALAPGAVVVLHDINLPLLHPECTDWGAKYLFDDLAGEKAVPDDCPIPGIGSIRIPADKTEFHRQLWDVLMSHRWASDVPPAYLGRLGLKAAFGAG